MIKSRKNYDYLSYCLIAAAVVAVFFLAPREGQFWWSESPRNALNGAFILDLIRNLPFNDPVGWAEDYYFQYPALTILFYPPLLHVCLAAFFAIGGVSHSVAVACIASFLFILALGVYQLIRRFSNTWVACAGTLLFLSAREVVIWGQQIMLEIPMLALVTWSAVFLLRYGDEGRARDLIITSVFMVAAIYTKQTAIFVIAGLGIALLIWKGKAIFFRRHVWIIFILSLVSLVPLIIIQLKFGSFNVQNVIDRPDVDLPDRFTWAGMSWYLMKLPQILGLPAAFLLVLCLPFAAVAFIRKKYSPARGDFLVALSWFLACYFFLTVIALKETRHGLLLVVPIVVFVGFALNGIIRERPFHYLQYLLPVAGAVLLAWTLREAPTPVVTGYHEAAEAVGELAPCNGRVLFVGNRDGAFIFNIRALPDRSDIQVVRADKLFLDINVMPSLGLNARDFDREQISDMLNRFGISLVVTVPRQWSEAPVMASLAEVLESDQFEEVRRFPVTGRAAAERELVLYRNRATLADPPEDFRSLVRVGGKSLDR